MIVSFLLTHVPPQSLTKTPNPVDNKHKPKSVIKIAQIKKTKWQIIAHTLDSTQAQNQPTYLALGRYKCKTQFTLTHFFDFVFRH